MKQMNNKLLSVVLVAGIASTGFAALSNADSNLSASIFGNRDEIHSLMQKIESGETLTADEQATLDEIEAKRIEMEAMKPILDKEKNGETLTVDEQAQLDAFQANMPEGKMFGPERGEKGGKMGFDGFGKRAGFAHLTDEEKTALASMTDDEKKAFFDTKKEEMQAEREAEKNVIDKLIAGDTLTADEEALRLELVTKFSDEDNAHPKRRDGGDIIAKLVAGDELTADEQTQLAEMQALHAEREAEKAKIDAMTDDEKQAYFEAKKTERDAQMEVMKPILEKERKGETLTADEQAQLDEFKANKPPMGPEMKDGRGQQGPRRGGDHGRGGHDGEQDDDMEVDDDMRGENF